MNLGRLALPILLLFSLGLGLSAPAARAQEQEEDAVAPTESDSRFIGPLPQQLTPEWSERAGYSYYAEQDRPNGMLDDHKVNRTISLIPKELQVEPVSQSQANALNQQYNDMMRPYEDREQRGIMTQLEREQRVNAARGFVNGVLNQIRSQQFVERRDKLIKMIPRKGVESAINAIPKPVQIAGAVVGAIATGQMLEWHLVPEASLRTQLDLPNQRSQLSLFTPVVDTSFSLRGQSAGNIDPNSPPPPINEFPAKSFRYEVSISKSIPELQLSTGLTYISTTESMRASLTKVIFPNLVAEVGTSQPLNPNNKLQPREESVRVQYGMQF